MLAVDIPEGHVGAIGVVEFAAGTEVATNVMSPFAWTSALALALDSAGNLYAANPDVLLYRQSCAGIEQLYGRSRYSCP